MLLPTWLTNRVTLLASIIMGVRRGGRGGPSPKSLEEIYFSLSGKNKIINIKEDYRNEKKQS